MCFTVFFFKQKPAYDMRISDWSSDVCSSDLNVAAMGGHYVDRPPPTYAQPGQRPVGLGEHRDLAGNPRPTADYANYYGTWAWERIFAAEDQAGVRHQGAAPRVVADMAGLGLKEDLIEMEGLDVGRNKVRRP